MEKNTWTMIEERITALSDLNKRMDETSELLHWDDNPYKLVKPDGKTPLRDAISVTPNLPKVFAHGVISDLMSGKWQTVVEGKVSPRQEHLIEEFVDDNLAQADEQLLINNWIPSLFSWLANHVCLRWAIGARWFSQVKDGEYQIDCLPVDMRWTPFVLGKWVASITFRDKDDLEEELEEYEKRAKSGRGTYTKPSLGSYSSTKFEVRDYWDKKDNELWVNKTLAYTQTNTRGYPPFVIVVPSSGFMLQDTGYLKHRGEDILFLNAGLYKELARSISLEQTSGYAGLYPGTEQEVANFDAQPAEPAPQLDENVKVRMGERHSPVPRGDINRAGQTAMADIQMMIEQGGPLSPRVYNTPPSAVLLAGETELITRLQNVRKEALGVFRSQLARMMIDQFREAGGDELLIGKRGKKGKYSAAKLGDPDNYTISYHLSVKSKRQELANLAEFAAVYDKLPLKWNLSNILMADDTDGIIHDLELDRAKAMNPALGLIDMGLRYLEEAESLEDEIEEAAKREQAKILAHEYVMAMRARIQPPAPSAERIAPSAQPQQIEQPRGNAQLLAQMGGAVGAMRGEAVSPSASVTTRQPQQR